MRVISGRFKGQKLKAPKGDNTRPTADRVKEAIFNTLGLKVSDAIVLDLFAGTGNLSIEALSRGAKKAFLVEKNRNSYKIIFENLKKLNLLSESELIFEDAEVFLKKIVKNGIKFDLVFLDPPYFGKYYNRILDFISENDILTENGVIITEISRAIELNYISDKLEEVKRANYGDTTIIYYQKKVLEA